jgi:hypothetical protein
MRWQAEYYNQLQRCGYCTMPLNVGLGMDGCVLAVGGFQEFGVFEVSMVVARETRDLKVPL